MLFSLGGSFLYYADRFKLYSAFCASHTKVPKVLVKGKNHVLNRQTWAYRERDVAATCWFRLVQVVLVDDERCLLYPQTMQLARVSCGGGMAAHMRLVAFQEPSQ